MEKKISVLGCGGFGLALAHLLAQQGMVYSWEYDTDRALLLQKTGKSDCIPYKLHKHIIVSHDIVATVKGSDYIFIAIPSQFVVETVTAVKRHFGSETIVVIGSKGLDPRSHTFLFDALQQKLSQKIVVLSGPMFAIDMVHDSPLMGVLAGKDHKKTEEIKKLFEHTHLHLETSDDLIGVSLVGALKNVYAIGSGIIHGLGLEGSSNAYYVSVAFREMQKLLLAYKGKEKTLLSPAGFGDLMLTCTSNKSRNFRFGEMVGKGIAPKHITMTIEGKHTLAVFLHMLQTKKIQAPLLYALYEIIYKNRDPSHLLTSLEH